MSQSIDKCMNDGDTKINFKGALPSSELIGSVFARYPAQIHGPNHEKHWADAEQRYRDAVTRTISGPDPRVEIITSTKDAVVIVSNLVKMGIAVQTEVNAVLGTDSDEEEDVA